MIPQIGQRLRLRTSVRGTTNVDNFYPELESALPSEQWKAATTSSV